MPQPKMAWEVCALTNSAETDLVQMPALHLLARGR